MATKVIHIENAVMTVVLDDNESPASEKKILIQKEIDPSPAFRVGMTRKNVGSIPKKEGKYLYHRNSRRYGMRSHRFEEPHKAFRRGAPSPEAPLPN